MPFLHWTLRWLLLIFSKSILSPKRSFVSTALYKHNWPNSPIYFLWIYINVANSLFISYLQLFQPNLEMFPPKVDLSDVLCLRPRQLPSSLPSDGKYLSVLPFLDRICSHSRSALLLALELARSSPAIRISRFALTCPRIVPSQCCVSQPWRNLR